ncbi:GtrA family protein [Marinicauda salina]|uniref:GtrA family protein n=1 Tax=Marinicauda salina TaxID=2135793 RepID=A0A2U2BRY8_9PROT|nr:GtrA family protein [Marinicauda salina]PWE16748.1 GtrA family protein [Marinicauda salina]
MEKSTLADAEPVMLRLKRRIPRTAIEAWRYLLVSAVGLAVDFGLLALLVEFDLAPLLIANAVSFTAGVIVVYLGSIGWVFGARRLKAPHIEFAIFAAVGIVGLGVNEAALWLVAEIGGVHYTLGKIAAAAASFTSNFLLRKALLFR